MSNNKLGFHVQATSYELEQAIDRCCPTDGAPFICLTMVDDVDFWRRMKEKHPNIFLIARRWVDAMEQQNKFRSNPSAAAIEMAQFMWEWGIINQNIADAVMSYNEFIGYDNPNFWNQADIFQEQFYISIKSTGYKGEPIAFNNGTGNLYGSEYINNFPRTLSKYKYYGFHSYGWPTMQNDWVYQSGRFIEAMDKIRQVVPHAQAIITECGVTNAVVGGQDVGYKTKWNDDEFWNNSLSFFNDQLLQYTWVVGSAVFMCGVSDHDRWDTFDILPSTFILDRMKELAQSNPQPRTNPIPPQPNTLKDDIFFQLDLLWGWSNLVTNPTVEGHLKEVAINIKDRILREG